MWLMFSKFNLYMYMKHQCVSLFLLFVILKIAPFEAESTGCLKIDATH